MIGWQDILRHYLNLMAPDGASVNFSWQRCRRAFLKKVGKVCACCGSMKRIEVHHKVPRHICPERATDPTNLIVLCGGGAKGCHFLLGHLGSYRQYNETILQVAMYVFKHSILKLNKKVA